MTPAVIERPTLVVRFDPPEGERVVQACPRCHRVCLTARGEREVCLFCAVDTRDGVELELARVQVTGRGIRRRPLAEKTRQRIAKAIAAFPRPPR